VEVTFQVFLTFLALPLDWRDVTLSGHFNSKKGSRRSIGQEAW